MSQSGNFSSGSIILGLNRLVGNDANAVGPDGTGIINVIGSNVLTTTGTPVTNTLTLSLINGNDGQVLIGGGVNPLWANLTSTGGTVTITNGANTINLEASVGGSKVTTYTVNDTWTKDSRTQRVSLFIWNGGSGGGSGYRGLSTSSSGGGGGAGGRCMYYEAPENFFDATESVTVGAGGIGGASQTINDTSGLNGSMGGTSFFGNVSIYNQPPANFGSTAVGRGGTAGNGFEGHGSYFVSIINFVPLVTPTNPGDDNEIGIGGVGDNLDGIAPVSDVGVNSIPSVEALSSLLVSMMPSGGGGGAGADAVTERTGGRGAHQMQWSSVSPSPIAILSGGSGGIESGTITGSNGVNGLTSTGGRIIGATGGGGGGGQSIGASAGSGGNGGFPGGGGGGGGGSLNGTNSGVGGSGNDGQIIVIEWF